MWFGRTEFSHHHHERPSLSRTTTRGSLSFKRPCGSAVFCDVIRTLRVPIYSRGLRSRECDKKAERLCCKRDRRSRNDERREASLELRAFARVARSRAYFAGVLRKTRFARLSSSRSLISLAHENADRPAPSSPARGSLLAFIARSNVARCVPIRWFEDPITATAVASPSVARLPSRQPCRKFLLPAKRIAVRQGFSRERPRVRDDGRPVYAA